MIPLRLRCEDSRTRRLRHAPCVFNNGASTLDVTLRDLSAGGARVVSDGLAFLPRTFDFRVAKAPAPIRSGAPVSFGRTARRRALSSSCEGSE